MPPITALLHTANDGLRLGRALETLFPCDEIVVVDYGSSDSTIHIAREYGARILPGQNGVAPDHYLRLARHKWILCLQPCESLTESLEASLFEWKSLGAPADALAFSVFLREETAEGWLQNSSPQVRLVSSGWNQWLGRLPAFQRSAPNLEGQLLRFAVP